MTSLVTVGAVIHVAWPVGDEPRDAVAPQPAARRQGAEAEVDVAVVASVIGVVMWTVASNDGQARRRSAQVAVEREAASP